MTKKTKVTANQIITALRALHTQKQDDPRALPDAFYTEVRSGPSELYMHPYSKEIWAGDDHKGLLIMDAVAVKKSWMKPCITGYEVKVSRSDFLRDRKWPHYRKYCHEFWFACPPNVVTLDDLSGTKYGDVGLIYFSAEHGVLFVKRRAMRRDLNLRSPQVMGMLVSLIMYHCGNR